jgi:hypothetical protein
MPTKTFRSSVTRKILEDFDNPLPGIIAASSMQKADLTENILEYNLDGWFSKAEKFYNYGKNKTVRGVPDEFAAANKINIVELRNVISTVIGNKIVFGYSFLDVVEEGHYVRQHLQDVRNMNPLTSIIPNTHLPTNVAAGATNCKFNDWEFSGSLGVYLINYTYEADSTVYSIQEELVYPWENSLVYQVSYFIVDEDLNTGDIPKYWTYRQGAGTYPTLDVDFIGGDLVPERYYPIVPFYIDKFQVGNPDNSNMDIYKDSKKLIEKLGFNYKELVTSLEEGASDSVGDNKGLWAYMYLGVDVMSGILEPSNLSMPTLPSDELINVRKNAQASLRYLVEFFKKEFNVSKYRKDRLELWKQSPASETLKYNSLGIVNEEFKTEFDYLYIEVTVEEGSLGKVGWCESEFILENTAIPLDYGNGEGVDNAYVDTSKIIYRMQYTPDSYTQVVVCGLVQKSLNKGNWVYIRPVPSLDNTDSAIIAIPLDRSLVKEKIPGIYRNSLIHSSLCFVFNAYIRVKVEWYQTFWARFVFYAVALYFAIPTGGKSISWAQLFTIEGLKAAAYALLFKLIKYVLYKEFIKIVAKHYGVEVAYLLAIATMAYGKFGNTSAFPKLPFAENLASIGNSMWSTTNKFIQESMKEVQRDQADVSYQMKEAQRELEKAQQLLKTDAELDPWLFVNPLPNLMFSHSATTFIDIRVHNSNPGIASLSAPSNYVDLMLTLPTIDDTLTK